MTDDTVIINGHRYPSKFPPPGTNSVLDTAWEILDLFDDTVSIAHRLTEFQRALLAGMIAGRISRK